VAPISRFGSRTREIPLPDKPDLTVRDLFTAIHSFYNEIPVTLADMEHHEDDDDYCKAAVEDLKTGKPVRFFNLVGSRRNYTNGDGLDVPNRREPFSCSGCVRYEGLRALKKDQVEILLGS
jgi:hypothetical protein